MDAMKYQTRRFLSLDDVRDRPYIGPVVDVVEEAPRNRWRPSAPVTPKLVLVFGDGRAVVCEGRNLDGLIAALGAETDDWIGEVVTVDVEVIPTASGRERQRKRITARRRMP
jgi:hypothetical protein